MVRKPFVLPYLSQSLLRWSLVNIYCNNVLKLLLSWKQYVWKLGHSTWKAQCNENFLKWDNFWYCFLWHSRFCYSLAGFFFQSLSQPAAMLKGFCPLPSASLTSKPSPMTIFTTPKSGSQLLPGFKQIRKRGFSFSYSCL